MVIESDYEPMFEVYKTRKKLLRWRIFGVLAVILVLILIAALSGAFKTEPADGKDHIARVPIVGTVTNNRDFLKMLTRIEEADNVKAVVLAMSTPGGTVVGGEAIYEAIKKLARKKPVVTQVSGLAASAGYMIASASDHIIARRSSIVGSIGVIFTYADATKFLDIVGLQVKDYKTGVFKAEPSPYSKTPPEVEPAMRELLDDSYQWFVDIVAQGRDLPRSDVLKLADGRVFSGTKAMQLNLVDGIGGEDEVLDYLFEEKQIDKSLELFTWRLPEKDTGLPFLSAFTGRLASDFLSKLGFSNSKQALGVFSVDGLVSIWQADQM